MKRAYITKDLQHHDLSGLLKLDHEPINRRQNRRAKKEFDSIIEALFEVELRFYHSLISTSEEISYQDIYQFYLKQFLHNIEALKKNVKPAFYSINTHYFEDFYKPIEFAD